jgi:hypothetical protein
MISFASCKNILHANCGLLRVLMVWGNHIAPSTSLSPYWIFDSFGCHSHQARNLTFAPVAVGDLFL